MEQKGKLRFTVDSELLRELGERLIGAPYIALAELVKNSYDADANKVTIDLDLAKEKIVVEDNGSGMTGTEFNAYWMRVGTVHKVSEKRTSEKYGRPMTGSKGVGRLSVQYLAGEMFLNTVSIKDPSRRLTAHVIWDDAVKAGDLTEATVDYEIEGPGRFSSGTRVTLTRLKQAWGVREVEGLAQQIWQLTPPFRSSFTNAEDRKLIFDIEFRSQKSEYIQVFQRKMRAVLELWDAKLTGKNEGGTVDLAAEFKGDPKVLTLQYRVDNCQVRDGNFEIRVYKLKGRQPGGIPLDEAREYFNKFGGVHVYDGGFHLPFYGDPKNDWLRVEFDHSHRLSMSKLLPPSLRTVEGMNFLPTLSRIFGVVNIDTSREQELKLLVTRDRLQDGLALEQLTDIARWPLDFYANEVARREQLAQARAEEISKPRLESIEEALREYKDKIPRPVYMDLSRSVRRVVSEYDTAAENLAKKASSLAPLATAGISALAAQHEVKRQFKTFDMILDRLREVRPADSKSTRLLDELVTEVSQLVERLKATNELFSYFADRDLKTRERLPARQTIELIVRQLRVLIRDIQIVTDDVKGDVLLPKGTFAEWSAVFQNVIINAYNAMLDSNRRVVNISSRAKRNGREIVVQDTGVGVDLSDSQKLFEPFERRLELSEDMRALGYGGLGLGLTIVRLVAGNLRCGVSFVPPERGYSTAFSLRWSESG